MSDDAMAAQRFPSGLNRRGFLRAAAATSALVQLPLPCRAIPARQRSANDALHVGCIGTGRMGQGDMRECLRQGLRPDVHARIVAVCDLDRQRAEKARELVRRSYTRSLESQPDVQIFGDYRELLARPDIDAVTISTPDHWHALVAVAAAAAGKGIYLQKPLTYSIAEGQQLVEAVRKHKVVLQTGSQQRSDGIFRRACELVHNGRLGTLRQIRVVLPVDSGFGDPTTSNPPPNLDYDRWLGPTPVEDYSQDRVHPQVGYGRPGWLQIESYCRGMITGWGAHMFDIAQWGHGSDHTGPVSMAATAEFPQRGLFNVHTQFRAEGHYADGVKLVAESGEPAGVTFTGDDGWLVVGRGYLRAEPADLVRAELGETETRLEYSPNHMRNFLQAVRAGVDPICPVEVGHRSNAICVITHIAMKLGRTLHWDPQDEKFVDDPAANAMLDYDHRSPWTV